MSNSGLVTYTKLSPNCDRPRSKKLSKITIHHMAGNLSVEALGDIFARETRQASANYGIDSNGSVALYVDEVNRAWTSGNPGNDNQAVTVEVANDGGEETGWHVSDIALAKLIDWCVDVCQRNGIPALNFTGDATGNLTMHSYFQNTACPGPYLGSQFPYIAIEVNRRLEILKTNPEAVIVPNTDVEVSAPVPEEVIQESAPVPELVLTVNIGGSEQWLGSVYGSQSDIMNVDFGYGGLLGRTIEGLCISLENAGFSVNYGVHIAGRTLPGVNSNNADMSNNDTGYAGKLGSEIDGVQMSLEGTDEFDIEYQVILLSGRILPSVFGKDANWDDDNCGYAGRFGQHIQGITARIVRR